MDNTILEYKTVTTDKGFIGHKEFKMSHLFIIFKEMCKNWIFNKLSSRHKYVKIWAIDDNENNYNIYFENYYE